MKRKKPQHLGLPVFLPNNWGKMRFAGCYPYALNIECNAFELIGDFIGERSCMISTCKLIEKLIREVTYLEIDIKQVEEDYETEDNEYLIYLKIFKHTGHYHFFRQDKDGNWSHKFPERLPEVTNIEEHLVKKDNRWEEGFFFALKEKSR